MSYSINKTLYSQKSRFITSEKLVSQTTAKRPLTTLQKNVKKFVIVRLKNEVEYKGKMFNVDSYMNLIMTDAEELHEGKIVGIGNHKDLIKNSEMYKKLIQMQNLN